MKPLWPLILMSSTLARDNSSVLRSRPIGLPRYQEKEKCGPRIPPPASHWQPTEFRAVFTSPVTRGSWATVWSLIPPLGGKTGPWLPFCDGAVDDPPCCGLFVCEPEHAATIGIRAAATTASAF